MAPEHDAQSITQLLIAASNGDPAARDRLWTEVMAPLRRRARALLAKEAGVPRIEVTSLISQAYEKLAGGEQIAWCNRRHFYNTVARQMRRILIDHGRKRKRLKHGGGASPAPLDFDPVAPESDFDRLELHEAIEQLEKTDPRRAEIVVLHYYWGLTGDEMAAVLGISSRTVDDELRYARAMLHKALNPRRDDA